MLFSDIGLEASILKAIAEMGFKEPTAIQEQTIPLLLENSSDVIGLAQTGTGKTAAFGLPVLNNIKPFEKFVQALVLCPTRELCIQITEELNKFSKYSDGVNITAIYGGDAIVPQIRKLKKGSQIVVATPGRCLDLIFRGEIKLNRLKYLILDEADVMVNMGFKEELDKILSTASKDRQTLLFSATMPKEVSSIAKGYMKEPIEITIGKKNSGVDTIEHRFYSVSAKNKYEALKRILDFYPGIYGIVFCKTKRSTQEIADKLIKDGYNAESLHGDLSQAQRALVMGKFKKKTIKVLVATDIAARGLDVDDLTHIIHYNLPDDNESYNHRSGRTGRAGKKGISIAIINKREFSKLKSIERILNRKIVEHQIPKGRDICEKQLLNLIDNMLEHKVNEKEIKPYWNIIEEKLKDSNPNEILLKFISLEFHRFLNYYADRPDIQKLESGSKKRTKKDNAKNSRFRNSYDDDYSSNRDINRDRNRDTNKDRNRSKNNKKNDNRFSNGGLIGININVGQKNRVTPAEIIGIINDTIGIRGINIGKIDIMQNQSRVMVDSTFVDKILNNINNTRYKNLNLKASRTSSRKKRGKR